MNATRLSNRIGCRLLTGRLGRLLDYSVVFNKKTSKNDYAYANIEYRPKNVVFGIIYELTPDELHKLDIDEGIRSSRPGYERQLFTIYDFELNQTYNAYAYIATDPRTLTNSLRPSQKYLNYFLENDKLPPFYKDSFRMI
jgi:hypothetical protein